MPGKVWFITGTSSGIGRALAAEALARGNFVVATARDPDSLADLVAKEPDKVAAIRLDVTRADEICDAVKSAISTFGRIDVLVNNAATTVLGAVEELSDTELRQNVEVLFFGPIAIIRAVLPY